MFCALCLTDFDHTCFAQSTLRMCAAWPQIRSREIGGKALIKALAEHAEMQVKFAQLDEFAEGFAAAVGKLPAKNKA